MDLNYNEEKDSFLFAIKFGNNNKIKDNEEIFILNGEEKCFDAHEIFNINYQQFNQKFNVP